jgi:hypothetical protein
MHPTDLPARLRAALILGALGLLLAATASPAAADQSNHTEHLAVTLTSEGSAMGYPALRAGQVVNIHAQGPVVFAIEDYLLNGARPATTYAVVLEFFAGSCSGAFAFPFANGVVLSTDRNGDAHGQARITPAEVAAFGLHDTDWGIAWTFVDPHGVKAYATACTQVHID